MTDEAVNVVGGRTLIAFQAVNISRLSTHPVPIVPGTLLVVAGQGPKDSNGAGKSSFIAAITALLGDEQWRFASGAQAISELLFNAELASQGDSQWASADHGYIVGVFGHASGEPEAQANNDIVTVWLRVNVDAPHLEIRWTEGLHLASAASEADRVRQADERWAELPRSAGRRDFLAKDLGRVLYGGQVRCVSFLSTSVRSRVATNLLSQPLNEISPERIFSAISALTGLDRELEAERKARAEEYTERAKAAEALDRLTTWEAEAAGLLKTFDRRDQARAALLTAFEAAKTRTARLLADGCEEDRALATALAEQRRIAEDADQAARGISSDIDRLADDQLDSDIREALKVHTELRERGTSLGEDRAVTTSRLDELRHRITELEGAAREADGRDVETAEAELLDAEGALGHAREAVGAAKGALVEANKALRSATAGESAAPEQLAALSAAGIPAVGLLDALVVSETDRASYEGALWPYRDALVVGSDQLDAAVEALAGLPGSVLVPTEGELDKSKVPAVKGFLAAVTDSVEALEDPARVVDGRTSAVVVGGFPDPLTGREARVRAAQARVDAAQELLEEKEEAAREAALALAGARRRLAGAGAAEQAERHGERVAGLRFHLEELAEQVSALEPQLARAEQSLRALQAKAENRDLQISVLEKERNRYTEQRFAARKQAAEVAEKRAALDLDSLRDEWGGSEASANEWLLGLDAKQQAWDPEAWRQLAEGALGEALRGVFPDGLADPDLPEQVRMELAYRREGEGTPAERERRTFSRLAEGLGSFLRDQEEYEKHQRTQLESQRSARRADFEAAQKGVAEASSASEAGRSTLTKAIRSRLTRVSQHFDELDRAYGGYGATLDFPTPERAADPEQEWRWRVTPKWRRAEGASYVPYNRRANTALMDEKAVKLVCAAALASAGGANLCLVLDELGRNLGKEHRREAVALFRQIGESHGITVLGALQDDMEPYAIDACGEYIKLRRSSDAMPYNEPPIVIGHDSHAERVKLLTEAVSRP
ncbi:coiled-coil domain-containing protein [Flindersiella endophytica]